MRQAQGSTGAFRKLPTAHEDLLYRGQRLCLQPSVRAPASAPSPTGMLWCHLTAAVYSWLCYHSLKEVSVKVISKRAGNNGWDQPKGEAAAGSWLVIICSTQDHLYTGRLVQLFTGVLVPSVVQQFTEPLRKIINFNENTGVNQQFKFNCHSNIITSLPHLSWLFFHAILKILSNFKC